MSIASPLARARTGLVAGIGLLLSCVALLGSSMHVLLVEHELCDEHGALVEGDAHAGGSSGEQAPDAHDTDVHCPLGVASTATLPFAPALVFESAHAAPIVHVFVLVDTPRPSADVWRVAPKTSPPSA